MDERNNRLYAFPPSSPASQRLKPWKKIGVACVTERQEVKRSEEYEKRKDCLVDSEWAIPTGRNFPFVLSGTLDPSEVCFGVLRIGLWL